MQQYYRWRVYRVRNPISARHSLVPGISYYCRMRTIEQIELETAKKRAAIYKKIAAQAILIVVGAGIITYVYSLAGITLVDEAISNLLLPLAGVSGTMLAVFVAALVHLIDKYQSIEERVTKLAREESSEISKLISADRAIFRTWYGIDPGGFFNLLGEFAGPEKLDDIPGFISWRERIAGVHAAVGRVGKITDDYASGQITKQELTANLTTEINDFNSSIVPRIHQIDIAVRVAERGRRYMQMAAEGRFIVLWLATATVVSLTTGLASRSISQGGITDAINPFFTSLAVLTVSFATVLLVRLIWETTVTVDEYIDGMTVDLWRNKKRSKGS
ncbi:MAG: hypothetical protein IH960_08755 [Chloroflexi bacterium]|nr:hypothetical protein [Chloroflexota bacterium]